MTWLVTIRHAPTAWNAESRLQGRRDTPLSDTGRALAAGWALPPDLIPGRETAPPRWLVSPLARARETAALLGAGDAEVVAELAEMSWGDWEGERLAELRARHGAAMTDSERRGLDLRPPGGESPRDVQARLAPLLRRLAAERRPSIAVCHNGVIRALYALATGWDMTGPPAEALRDGCAHRFRLAPDGAPRLDRLNIALARRAAAQ